METSLPTQVLTLYNPSQSEIDLYGVKDWTQQLCIRTSEPLVNNFTYELLNKSKDIHTISSHFS